MRWICESFATGIWIFYDGPVNPFWQTYESFVMNQWILVTDMWIFYDRHMNLLWWTYESIWLIYEYFATEIVIFCNEPVNLLWLTWEFFVTNLCLHYGNNMQRKFQFPIYSCQWYFSAYDKDFCCFTNYSI